MAMYRKALIAFTVPFRALLLLLQIACFLLLSAACILVAAFVGYLIVLTFSYAFLPLETTENLWQWAADLYAQSPVQGRDNHLIPAARPADPSLLAGKGSDCRGGS